MKKRNFGIFAVILLIVSLAMLVTGCTSTPANGGTSESTPSASSPLGSSPSFDESFVDEMISELQTLEDELSNGTQTLSVFEKLQNMSFSADGTVDGGEPVSIICKDGIVCIESGAERAVYKLYPEGMAEIITEGGRTHGSVIPFDGIPSVTSTDESVSLSFTRNDLLTTETGGVYTLSEEYTDQLAESLGMNGSELNVTADLREYKEKGTVSLSVTSDGSDEGLELVLNTKDRSLSLSMEEEKNRLEVVVKADTLAVSLVSDEGGESTELEMSISTVTENGSSTYNVLLDASSGDDIIKLTAEFSESGAITAGQTAAELRLEMTSSGASITLDGSIKTVSFGEASSKYELSLELASGENTSTLTADVNMPCDRDAELTDREQIYIERADRVFADYGYTVATGDEISAEILEAFKKKPTDFPKNIYKEDEKSGIFYVSTVVLEDNQYKVYTDAVLENEYYTYFFVRMAGKKVYDVNSTLAIKDAKQLHKDVLALVPENYEAVATEYMIYKYIERVDCYVVMPYGKSAEAVWVREKPTSEMFGGKVLHEYKEGEPHHDFEETYDDNCNHYLKCADCGFGMYSKDVIHGFGELHTHSENGEAVWDYTECIRCGYAEMKLYAYSGIVQNIGLTPLKNNIYSETLYEVKDYLSTDDIEELLVISDLSYTITGTPENSNTITIPNIDETGRRIIGVKNRSKNYSLPYNTDLVLPEGLEFIARDGLKNVQTLTGIVLPESTVYIGNDAFAKAPLKELVIPKNVRCLSFNFDLNFLESLTVNATHLPYLSVRAKNLKYLEINSQIDTFGGIRSVNITKFTVPDGVIRIADGAFAYNKTLEELILPETVEYIGAQAFMGCTALKEMIIPNSLKEIGEGCFEDCDSLTTVWCIEGGELLGESELVRLPESLEILGVSAFKSSGITSVEVFGKCKMIEAYAFSSCGKLKNVTLHEGVEKLNIYAFERCGFTDIVLPEGLRSIEEGAFLGCKTLKSVTVSEGVGFIGNKAFKECVSLKNISLPNTLSRVGNDLFYECTAVEYTVYDKAKYLGNESNPYVLLCSGTSDTISYCEIHPDTRVIAGGAFHYYFNIKKIIIPDSVVYIGDEAFRSSRNILEISVGSGISDIGKNVFVFDKEEVFNEYENGLYIGNEKEPYMILVRLKDKNVTSFAVHPDTRIILDGAFDKCKSLTSVTLGTKIFRIGERAFSECDALETVVIPEGVEYIEREAFYRCDKLSNIVLPVSLKELEAYVFSGCDALYELSYNGTVAELEALIGTRKLVAGYRALTVHCTDGDVKLS